MTRFVLRRVASGLVVLLVITYVSFLTQDFALRSRRNEPAPVGQVAAQALQDTVRLCSGFLRGRAGTYIGPRGLWGYSSTGDVADKLGGWVANSLGLLVLAMALGGLFGGLVGTLAAACRRPGVSLALVLSSIVGISTPSFFLGMLLQYLEITVYKLTGVRLVPVGGSGWDSHLVLPVLVLAARPTAQVARITYVKVSAILDEDYVRTAQAKGLPWHAVWWVHIIPNVASSVLTAMGMSLRFSLSSLPVVEFLFGWPGAGRVLLDALRTSQREGATTLVLAMGALFVAVNVLLDVAYHVFDPRLREANEHLHVELRWQDWLRSMLEDLWAAISLRRWRERRRASSVQKLPGAKPASSKGDVSPGGRDELRKYRQARLQAWVRATTTNPALILGLVVGALLLAVVLAGPALAPHNPYVASPTLVINGERVQPPVAPSALFPLGTDRQGRDILSLILVGARRTLAIAVFAVIARLLVGGVLGFIAGWFAGTRLDRTILGLAETLAAFPALLMAMLIVYAIGVRQGMSAFVVALSTVGWGEVMQAVRSQVMAIKPMAYIEGAVSIGLNESRILSAHVLPNVWPTMVSLAFLEMGGVLMLLGELGFLGVFIGGGFTADAEDFPLMVYYDVPEWSVMLANSWRQFRSFPWASLYPALAFFCGILGFTFLGEGLRQLTERLTLSLRSLFNRYTLAIAVLVLLGVRWVFVSTGFAAQYAPRVTAFDTDRAMADIAYLAADAQNGRLSGTADADRVAEWIAGNFEALGLQPGGSAGTYFQTYAENYRNLVREPTLTLSRTDGTAIHAVYGRDFTRDVGRYDIGGTGRGELVIVGLEPVMSWMPSDTSVQLGLSSEDLVRTDRIVLRLDERSAEFLSFLGRSGVLTMSEYPLSSRRYELLAQSQRSLGEEIPSVLVSRDLVERILAPTSNTAEELLRRVPRKVGDEGLYLPTGWTVELSVPARAESGVEVQNVIGVWAGEDAALDAEAIVVAAYYDGLGRFPDGTLYPGANDNASGVAAMLEMVRTLKEQGFRPKRTIMFVAWIGGERHRMVDYPFYLKAHPYFADAYKIVAGLELEGVGAGTGSSAVIWNTTRERLTEVVQQAARRVRTPLTTREQGLHADRSLWPYASATVPSATISWSGSDDLAHTPQDTLAHLDPGKLGQVGRMVSLAVMVLANDPAY